MDENAGGSESRGVMNGHFSGPRRSSKKVLTFFFLQCKPVDNNLKASLI